jgi:hypothetical protein
MLAKGLREPEYSLVNSQSFSLLFLVHGCLLSFFFLLSPSFSSSFVLGSKITAAKIQISADNLIHLNILITQTQRFHYLQLPIPSHY